MGLFKKILSSLLGNSYEEEEMETEVINSNSEIAVEEETAAKNKALIGVLQFLKRRLEEQETAKKILEEAYAKQTAKETSEAKQMAAEAERKLAEVERKLADTERKLEVAQRMTEEKTAKQTAEETLADKEIEEGPTIIDNDYINELIKNGIKEVILPASVEEIRPYIRADFVSIDMSKCHKLTKIDKEKFAKCKSLERIDLPDSITTIGEQAFYGCESLKSIRLPKNLTSIGEGAFWECKSLKSIVLPKNLTSLGECAFHGCESLESIVLPENLTSIVYSAFGRCESLEEVDLSLCEKLKEIGGYVFQNCKSLESIKLPENLISIEEYAFSDCESLRSIEIPDTVKRIKEGAFSGCKLLRKLSLPESLKKLESLTGDYRSTINVDLSKCKNIKVLSEKLDYANEVLPLPMGVEEVLADVLPSDVKVVLLPPTMKVMEDSADNILCYAPELESLDFRGVLYVLPKYYDSYCEQASIEGANIQVEKIPDEYLYFYDE